MGHFDDVALNVVVTMEVEAMRVMGGGNDFQRPGRAQHAQDLRYQLVSELELKQQHSCDVVQMAGAFVSSHST